MLPLQPQHHLVSSKPWDPTLEIPDLNWSQWHCSIYLNSTMSICIYSNYDAIIPKFQIHATTARPWSTVAVVYQQLILATTCNFLFCLLDIQPYLYNRDVKLSYSQKVGMKDRPYVV